MEAMRSLALRGFLLASVTSVVAATSCAGNPALDEQIHRLLAANCTPCHGENRDLQGGLDLRTLDTILSGGKSGPAVFPGDVDGSLLFEMVSTEQMPPDDVKLSRGEIEVIARWIAGL